MAAATASASTGALDRNLSLDATRVCEAAAIAAERLAGRGDEMAADKVAVEAMRQELNKLDINGVVVIGEGERDEAPLLFIGDKVGTGKGKRVDIALDPLEGTTLTAKAMANALAVVAFTTEGGMLQTPDTYMDKIAIGPGYPAGIVDLDASPADNVRALAEFKGVPPEQITACVLDRPRHKDIIASLRDVGARVQLISDGDVAGVINTADPSTGIDIYLGQGGAPEGVLACAALKCVGGQFQGRLVFRNEDEKARARRLGLKDSEFDRKYDLNELVSGEAVFAATGVTDGALLDGVKIRSGFIETHSLVMTTSTGRVREIRTRHPI
jgi:fructose-1,6-bisphosphatase II / sedoheptulose-1,7-bisphosphatase